MFPYLLLSPTLAVLALFVLGPALYSVYLSFHVVDAFTYQTAWIGIENYLEMLSSPAYWQSLSASIGFMLLTVIPSVSLSLLFAMGLSANPYFGKYLRTIFLMPVGISSAMAAMLWVFLYNPTAGYLNYALSFLGVRGPSWLSDPTWALMAVAIATIWKEIGFNLIFFLAGLASLPGEILEASKVDGANPWQRFWYVVLPLLSPTLFFVSVVSVIHSFDSFGQIHILTRGGPAGSTNVMVYSLYREAFENFRTGYASAQAVVLFAVILAVTAVQFRFAKKRVHYG